MASDTAAVQIAVKAVSKWERSMPAHVAISVHNLGKCHNLYTNPTDKLKELLSFGKLCLHSEFWALRDISFDVAGGETVGIVGRNGSGKSTLLQIICSTLAPTVGTVRISGRVAALLELGSGFNPEFTGKENVYLNATLLGLSPEDIREKYEAILEFADIGQFVDQPVKTYSSGMRMRLAFAVAINVEPEILVIDEALAVGDELFQQKCFARIREFREKGGTILFVSHSAGAVVQLCDRAILLDKGEAILIGTPKAVITKYQQLCYAPPEKRAEVRTEIQHMNRSGQAIALPERRDLLRPVPRREPLVDAYYDPGLVPKSTVHYPSRGAEIINPRITTPEGRIVNNLVRGRDYIYTYAIDFTETLGGVRAGMMIKTLTGLELGGGGFPAVTEAIPCVEAESRLRVRFRFRCLLNPGVYFLNAGCQAMIDGEMTYAHRCIDVAAFRVQPEPNAILTAIVDFCLDPTVEYEGQAAGVGGAAGVQ